MFSLRLLAGLSLEGPAGPLSGRAVQRRRLALLALLGVAGSKGVNRERLMAYLWPESEEASARHLLSDSLYVLHRALGNRGILLSGDMLRLNQNVVNCDVQAFERALARDDLEHAAALYAGSFMNGFHISGLRDFEAWMETERRRLADLYGRALESLAARAETARDFPGAAMWWKRLVAHDPHSSRVVLRLMQALETAGDPANALEYGRTHARLLQDELGIQPSEELQTHIQRLTKALSPARAPATPPARERVPVERPATPPPGPEAAAARATPISRGWRLRRRVTLSAAGASALLGAAAWLFLDRIADHPLREAAADFDADRVVVLPFHHRGSEDDRHLGAAMVDLLSATLDGAGDLRTVSPSVVFGVVRNEGEDTVDPLAVARRLSAGRYVSGEVVEAGGRLRISARLFDLRKDRGDAVNATVEGDLDDLIRLIDELTRQLLLGTGVLATHMTRMAVSTTESLPALKAYLSGEARLRAGDAAAALQDLQRASTIDSTFALAWYRLAQAIWLQCSWRGWDDMLAATTRAVGSAGQLPPRERKVLEGYRALLNGDADSAERLFRSALIRYPEDVDALHGLFTVLALYNPLRGRQQAEWLTHAQHAAKLQPHSLSLPADYAYAAAASGNWSIIDSLFAHNARLRATKDSKFLFMVAKSFASGDKATQRQIISSGVDRRPLDDLRAAQFSALAARDVPRSLVEFARAAARRASRPEVQALAHLVLAQFELARGHLDSAEDQLARLAEIAPAWANDYRALWWTSSFVPANERELYALRDSLEPPRPSSLAHGYGGDNWVPSMLRAHDQVRPHLRLYLLARVHARLGDHSAALRHSLALEGKRGPAAAPTLPQDLAHAARALISHTRERPSEALRAAKRSRRVVRPLWLVWASFFTGPEDRFLRAKLLADLGRDQSALLWFESIGAYIFDAPYLAPAHREQARIYARLGKAEKARYHYTRFLELWQDADPRLQPQVEAARQALLTLAAGT